MIEIILMFYGIYALIRGRFQLIPRRTVTGPHARLAGLVLVLSPALQFVYFFLYGMNMARTHRYTSSVELQTAMMAEIQGQALTIGIVCLLIAITISAIIAATAPAEYVIENGAAGKAKRKLNKNVSVEDAAALLHITTGQVLNLIQDKKLVAKWVDGTYEIDQTSFDRYMLFDRHAKSWETPPASSTPASFSGTAFSAPASSQAPVADPIPSAGNATLKPFEDAVLQNPNDVKALFNRARAYYSAGLTGMAALDFARVLQLQPDHPNAASMRGFILQYGSKNQTTTNGFEGGEQIRS